MTILQAIGLAALTSLFLWPLTYIPWVAEQHAVAVRSHAMAQCVGAFEMRKVQRTCEQMQ